MGNLEVRGVDGVVAVEEDVEVDEARALGECLFAAHLRLDLAEDGQELRGGEIGLRLEHCVQEPGLLEVVDGLCLVDARKL